MALAIQRQYRVVSGDDVVETYTRVEALETARQIAQQEKHDVTVYDHNGVLIARVFLYEDSAYVDQYLNDRVAVCEIIVGGKPRIAGTRIPVSIILDYLAQGVTAAELISDDFYPDLTLEDILACVAYASNLVQQAAPE